MDNPEQSRSSEERYLDVHETAKLLGMSEAELWELVHRHEIPTHSVAGAFLRFDRVQMEDLKNKWRINRELFPKSPAHFARKSAEASLKLAATSVEKLRDFWYFNDFYFICSIAMAMLLYFITSSQ